jgi:hypothetical protein
LFCSTCVCFLSFLFPFLLLLLLLLFYVSLEFRQSTTSFSDGFSGGCVGNIGFSGSKGLMWFGGEFRWCGGGDLRCRGGGGLLVL